MELIIKTASGVGTLSRATLASASEVRTTELNDPIINWTETYRGIRLDTLQFQIIDFPRQLMKLAAGLATSICTVLFAASPAIPQPAKADRIVIEYVAPTNSAHQPLYDLLKQKQALERVRDLLVGVRWPRTLRLEFEGCDGDANAWYEDAVITVCYEFLDEMWRNASSSRLPSTISLEDAFVGPAVNVFLHEASHALFRLLKIPLLGQEEDAADQLAAYFVLQFPKERKRGLILGYAYAFASELKVRRPRDLTRPRVQLGRHVMFADVHDTPAQRLYSLLCLAYGSDKELFADVVEKGFLPKERSEICEDEYRQVDFAYRTLIAPHVDSGR